MSAPWVAFFVGAVVWIPLGAIVCLLAAAPTIKLRRDEAYIAGLEAGKVLGRKSVWKEAVTIIKNHQSGDRVA